MCRFTLRSPPFCWMQRAGWPRTVFRLQSDCFYSWQSSGRGSRWGLRWGVHESKSTCAERWAGRGGAARRRIAAVVGRCLAASRRGRSLPCSVQTTRNEVRREGLKRACAAGRSATVVLGGWRCGLQRPGAHQGFMGAGHGTTLRPAHERSKYRSCGVSTTRHGASCNSIPLRRFLRMEKRLPRLGPEREGFILGQFLLFE